MGPRQTVENTLAMAMTRVEPNSAAISATGWFSSSPRKHVHEAATRHATSRASR